jgi:hypothetical protein
VSAKFDMSDVCVRRMLYVFHNRKHDGEIWLAARRQGRMFLVEQSECPSDVEVLGEVESKIVDGEFVDDIASLQRRSVEERQRMRQQAEEHRAYRAELYKRYSLAERLADLNGKVETKA